MHRIVTLETPALGNRCYLAHDGEQALVVDPPRDIERVEQAAEQAGVRVAAVAETHVHNDFVSGARQLARRHRAEHLVAAAESVRFDRAGVADGDQVPVGGLRVEVLATPGHTPAHVAYLASSAGGAPPALFSGGSLLFGTVGRTDLAGQDLAAPLARAQVRSVRRLVDLLPADTALFPTHGFGSFCASTPVDGSTDGTLAQEARRNPALDGRDEEAVARALLAGYGPVPAHYAHMADLNRCQDLSPAQAPVRLGPTEVRAALEQGVPVVDVRRRPAYAARHLEGSLSIEYGAQCATYVGWLLPWGTKLVLVGDDEQDLAAAVADLGRIGIDGLVGVGGDASTRPPEPCGYRRLGWEGLAEELRSGRRPLVVDVRTRAEFADGHVRGAISAPVHELPDLPDSLPPGEAWVHCKSGYRAGIAASLLHAAGRDVVHLDDDWERAAAAGVPVVLPASN